MRLPFHLVIDFAHTKPGETKEAFKQFFNGIEMNSLKEEEIFPLFAEWLIYDYRQKSGASFIAEYVLRDPDKLDVKTLSQLKQAAETNKYGGFEIVSVKRGSFIRVEHLFSGETFDIYDHIGSLNINEQGTIIGRIAKIDKKWYLIGTDPSYLGHSFTKRMRRMLKGQIAYPSPRDTLQLLINQTTYTEPPRLSKKDITEKRKQLQQDYSKLCNKYNASVTFEVLIKKIFDENGGSPMDIWQNLIKNGISELFFLEHIQLFQDIWNYFPHKILKGKCPVELYQKLNR